MLPGSAPSTCEGWRCVAGVGVDKVHMDTPVQVWLKIHSRTKGPNSVCSTCMRTHTETFKAL